MLVWFAIVVIVILIFLVHYFFPYFFKAFRLTILRGRWTATPYDLHDFDSRKVAAGKTQKWLKSNEYNQLEMSKIFRESLIEMKTSAFLVARHGKLIHEEYFGKHRKDTLSNSFSMAKTIIALMAGKAIEEGFIEDLDQKVVDFFSQYDYPPANMLVIRDLLRMSSGMDWEESYYLPLNVTTEAYYGNRLSDLILERKIISDPGKSFEYQSSSTQLMGMILDKVLPETLSDWLSEKFWKPMGMEQTAYWTIEKESNIEKTYCCIHAIARDFLKFGQLFLQDGRWEDRELISKNFISEMRKVGFAASPQYGTGLWLDDSYNPPFYLMRGHLGQYVIIIPSEDLVICRIGEKYMNDDNPPRLQLEDIYMYVDGTLEMLKSK